ncbi:MAG TPA: GDSL-type esterase/lipase family protein, partial [Myxococcota bacterium]
MIELVVLALVAAVSLALGLWIASAFVRATALPARAPKRVLALSAPSKRRVAFLGASLTHGKVSADWVSLVGQALDVDVVNAGVNGDLAWSARLRLEDVLATKPNDLVVLVGSNDVMAGLDAVRERRYMTSKNLPQRPTLAWYRDNLIAIGERAKSASVSVLFASLPPLGEDLDSDVNKRVQSANEIIALVAQETGARFVDVYAPLAEALRAAGAKR